VYVLYGNDGGIMRVCTYVFPAQLLVISESQQSRATGFNQYTPTHAHTQNIRTIHNVPLLSYRLSQLSCSLIKPFVHEHPIKTEDIRTYRDRQLNHRMVDSRSPLTKELMPMHF